MRRTIRHIDVPGTVLAFRHFGSETSQLPAFQDESIPRDADLRQLPDPAEQLPDRFRFPKNHDPIFIRISSTFPPWNRPQRATTSFARNGHPPACVPYAPAHTAARFLPSHFRTPLPHALVTRISSLPSPSKSPM